MKSFTLVINEPPDIKQEIELTRSYYVIGRGGDCDLKLISAHVSRAHAYLTRMISRDREPYYRIVDGSLAGLRSRNGLIVNNKRITSHDLSHGDRVLFAPDVWIDFFVHGEITDSGEDTVA